MSSARERSASVVDGPNEVLRTVTWRDADNALLRLLAQSPKARSLRDVAFALSPKVDDDGAAALAASEHLSEIGYLQLYQTSITQRGKTLLGERFGNRINIPLTT